MANTTITALAAASTLTGSEVAPIDQSGATVKVTVAAIRNGAINNVSVVAATGAVSGTLFFTLFNVSFNVQTCWAEGAPSNGDTIASTEGVWTDVNTGNVWRTGNSGAAWTQVLAIGVDVQAWSENLDVLAAFSFNSDALSVLEIEPNNSGGYPITDGSTSVLAAFQNDGSIGSGDNADGSNLLFGGNTYDSTAFGSSLDLSGNTTITGFISTDGGAISTSGSGEIIVGAGTGSIGGGGDGSIWNISDSGLATFVGLEIRGSVGSIATILGTSGNVATSDGSESGLAAFQPDGSIGNGSGSDGSNLLFGGNTYDSTAFGSSLDLSENTGVINSSAIGSTVQGWSGNLQNLTDAGNADALQILEAEPNALNGFVTTDGSSSVLAVFTPSGGLADGSGADGSSLLFGGNTYDSTAFGSSLDLSGYAGGLGTADGSSLLFGGNAYNSTAFGSSLDLSGQTNLPKQLFAGSFSGSGTATTAFVVTIGVTLSTNTYKVCVTPTSALSAAVFYVTSKSTTQFTVTYLAGLTGTVTFDWIVAP